MSHTPQRGDAVETWLKALRDRAKGQGELREQNWDLLDGVLDDYRLAADQGEVWEAPDFDPNPKDYRDPAVTDTDTDTSSEDKPNYLKSQVQQAVDTLIELIKDKEVEDRVRLDAACSILHHCEQRDAS